MKDDKNLRTFETGATRDTAHNKLDFESILSPAVLLRYVQYMDKHKTQSDGSIREGDNWQKGMPKNQYTKSLIRHTMDLWLLHRKVKGGVSEDVEEILCAIIFNSMGYLFEILTRGNIEEEGPEKMSDEKRANILKMQQDSGLR